MVFFSCFITQSDRLCNPEMQLQHSKSGKINDTSLRPLLKKVWQLRLNNLQCSSTIWVFACLLFCMFLLPRKISWIVSCLPLLCASAVFISICHDLVTTQKTNALMTRGIRNWNTNDKGVKPRHVVIKFQK